MQYTMYYEEQQKIDYDEYGRLKQQLLQKEENQKFEKYTLRKLKFRGDVSNEAVPHYYLCVKNQDEVQFIWKRIHADAYLAPCVCKTEPHRL